MKIGTDVDFGTCRAEGYLMMEYKKRELISKGVLNPNTAVRFFAHYPDYCLEEIYGTPNPVGIKTILTDIDLSANDVWGLYLEDKESIDSFCGLSHEFPTCEFSLLNLASDVKSYKGLD